MSRTGILLALLSALLFGASTPFAKLLLGAVDPWMMAGLLYLGAGLGLAAFHLSRGLVGLSAVEAPLRRADLPWLALVVRRGRRDGAAAADVRACSDGRGGGVAAAQPRRPGDDGDRLAGVPRECRPPAAARRPGDPCRRRRAVLARAGVVPVGRAADRRGVPLLGHRQQPDAQAVLGRSGADRDDQGAGCGHGQPAARACERRAPAVAWNPPGGAAGSASSATASVSRCSCSACATSAPRAPRPISRSHPSPARCSPCSCWASRCRRRCSSRAG